LASGIPFKDDEGRGVVQIRYVEPGRYVLANPEIYLRRGMVLYTQKPKQQIEIPFEVTRGRCVYLGRLLLKPDADEFLWLDRRAEDLAVATPNLSSVLVVDAADPPIRSIGGVVVAK